MKNIVVYARYSSEKQTEQSIEGQLRVCHEYAERNNLNIIKEYIDRAMTGTNDNRPEFQKMIEDSSKKQFEYVLVYKLDRFSRSKYDNAIYKHKLQLNGVRVISATEAISNTPEGALMEGLLEMFAELYSKDLSQKVKRGIRESILKEQYIGGNILYGYKVKDKKIYIDEEKAPAVKFIFEQYANGVGKQEIIDKLNLQGYKTNKNKKFTLSSLNRCLSNKKYIGYFKNEYFESSTYYPAIIDKELFNKVQVKLAYRKRVKKHTKENFILTGKLYCGICGEPMIGLSGYGKQKIKYLYYGCTAKSNKRSCKKKNNPKDKLEEKVFNEIFKILSNKENLLKIANGIISEYENSLNKKTLDKYQMLIDDINKKLDNITNQLIDNNNSEIISRLNLKAKELADEKSIYEEQIRKIKLSLSIKHSKEEILEYLKFYTDIDYNDEKQKQKLLDSFVNSIYVFDDFFYIHFNVINIQPKITLKEVKTKLSSSVIAQGSPKQITIEHLPRFLFYQNGFGVVANIN